MEWTLVSYLKQCQTSPTSSNSRPYEASEISSVMLKESDQPYKNRHRIWVHFKTSQLLKKLDGPLIRRSPS